MDQISIEFDASGSSSWAPPTLVHRTSIARALTTLPRSSSRLGRTIAHCLMLPPDGTGLIAMAEALCAACAPSANSEERHGHWHEAFRQLSHELQDACAVSHELDRARLIAGHPKRHVAIAFIEPLTLDLGPEARAILEYRRRRLYLHAVTNQLEISGIGLQLRQLSRPTSVANRANVRLLSEPIEVLAELVAAGATTSKWQRVIHAVMQAITQPLADFPVAKGAGERPPAVIRLCKTRTFLEVKVLSTRARSIFQGSGLAPFQGSMLPAYFERLISELPIALALRDESQYAVAAYFVSFLGVSPRYFPLVSLAPEADAVHLDVERGVVRWPIRGLVKTLPRWQGDDPPVAGGGNDWVEVPQAEELMQWARAQLALRPGSTSLDQLFDLGPAGWMAGFEAFLHKFSLTSRDLTIERLVHGVPRLAYAAGLDAMYVDAFFCVAGLVPQANYHYATLRAGTMNETARHIYRHLGLTGRLAHNVTRDASLGPAPSEDTARRVVQQSLASVANAASCLPPRAGIEKLREVLKGASLPLLSAVVFITAHRGTRVETIARSHFSFDRCVWFAADKFPEEIRPIPLPAQLVAYFEAYFALVRSVAYRLRTSHAETAKDLVRRVDPRSMESLFVMLDAEGTVRALTAADVAAWLGDFGVARNDGRRFLANALQDAGLSIADENAVAGRAGDGQRAYSESSALVPALVVEKVCAVLRRILDVWSLPQPHVLAGRTIGPRAHRRSPLPVRRPSRPRQLYEPEPCAFRLHDGFRLTQYAAAKSRFERNVPDDALTAFTHALIFESGVEHEDELICVLELCIAGRAHVHAGLGYVHTSTPNLGLRELKIGRLSTSLIDKLPADLPGPLELRRRLDNTSGDLLHVEQTEGALAELLDAARTAHAYGLPGPIREFACGRLTPSTLSLQARARQLSQPIVEAMLHTEPRSHVRLPPRRGATALKIELKAARLLVAKVRKKQRRSVKSRIRLLKRLLMGFSTDGMSDVGILVVDVMRHIAQVDDAPATVVRYERAIRDLLEKVPPEIRKFRDRLAVFDWGPLVERALAAARSEGDASVRKAAYYHLFAVLRISFGSERQTVLQPPRSAVDALSRGEVQAALKCIAGAAVPERIRMKAAALMLVRISIPTRSDELRWLRWCDVHIGSTLLVTISEVAGAALKTPLAARDSSTDADPRLRDILRSLQAVNSGDRHVFMSEMDPSELSRVEALVEGALKAVACSREINAMALRRHAINTALGMALSPATNALRSTEQLRSDLISASGTAGHSSCWTALRSYAHDFSEWRHAWFAEGKSGLGLSPSAVSKDRITRGSSLSAARKQVQRTRSRNWPVVAAVLIVPPKRALPLVTLAPSTERATAKRPQATPVDVANRLGYLSHRLAGDTQSDAEVAVAIDRDSVLDIEANLSAWVQRGGTLLRSTELARGLGRSSIRLMTELHSALAGAYLDAQAVEALVRAIRAHDEPWLFDHEAHARVLEPLLRCIRRTQVSLEIKVSRNCSRVAVLSANRMCEELELSAPGVGPPCGFAALRDSIQFDFHFPAMARRLGRVLVTATVLLFTFDFLGESS
jgi:hypothetical protein